MRQQGQCERAKSNGLAVGRPKQEGQAGQGQRARRQAAEADLRCDVEKVAIAKRLHGVFIGLGSIGRVEAQHFGAEEASVSHRHSALYSAFSAAGGVHAWQHEQRAKVDKIHLAGRRIALAYQISIESNSCSQLKTEILHWEESDVPQQRDLADHRAVHE